MKVIFEERKDGRTDALLGAVTVATIIPVDHPPARGAFMMMLPPWGGFWEFATDADEAKAAVTQRVDGWLQAAGLKGIGP